MPAMLVLKFLNYFGTGIPPVCVTFGFGALPGPSISCQCVFGNVLLKSSKSASVNVLLVLGLIPDFKALTAADGAYPFSGLKKIAFASSTSFLPPPPLRISL
jgi:hypothetical protein